LAPVQFIPVKLTGHAAEFYLNIYLPGEYHLPFCVYDDLFSKEKKRSREDSANVKTCKKFKKNEEMNDTILTPRER
jgi:hypothetical protein